MIWQHELRDAIKTELELSEFLAPEIIWHHQQPYKIFIPQALASKIKILGPNSPLWKQFIPDEFENNTQGLADPIGDQQFLATPQIIHRYLNRVLFIPSTNCPIVCRYCFRKNELFTDEVIFKSAWEKSLEYLENHLEINEVIFSGGDPLVLNESKLQFYLSAFAKIKHIRFIRFHTRTPVVLPSRITVEFIEMLKNFSQFFDQLSFVFHINHSDELDSDVINALEKFKQLPLNLMAQTVLLKGVNDDSDVLLELFKKLGQLNIRPYYLHHPDQAKGTNHFYLSIEEGRKIYATLRNQLPGWLLPQYVVDIPNGKGKVNAFNPENFEFSGNLIGLDGEFHPYTLIDKQDPAGLIS